MGYLHGLPTQASALACRPGPWIPDLRDAGNAIKSSYMCVKQLCCLKWMIVDLLLSCQANACNGRDAQPVVLVVGRRGMVVPVQLGAESSCVCITAAILTILPLSWN